MKKSDFHIPCTFETRRPCLLDQLLFIPAFFSDHKEFSHLQITDQLFAQKHPIAIEYCSGNGQWIIERCKNYPHINWIAVEMRFDRARKIWLKMHNNQLKNLFVVFGEALTLTQHYIPQNLISAIYINFPDPWPKEKHAKHRLISPEFIQELHRITRPQGQLTFVTDDSTYCDTMCSEALAHKGWRAQFPKPYYLDHIPQDYGSSYFQNLWQEKNRNMHFLQFSKK